MIPLATIFFKFIESLFTEISQSQVNDIAQAKPSKSNGDETQTKKNIEQNQPTRFS